MAIPPNMAAAHAAARFGLGAMLGELKTIGGDPQGWAVAQIHALPDTVELLKNLADTNEAARLMRPFYQMNDDYDKRQTILEAHADDPAFKAAIQHKAAETAMANIANWKLLQDMLNAEVRMRLFAGIQTKRPLHERMLRFWSNHFTTSTGKFYSSTFPGVLERDAIRPHLFGRFETMLRAVTEHPGMIYYLTNEGSVGSNSLDGKKSGGLNENLAREILELHTLGVNGGYTQADVTGFARILTGWTVTAEAYGNGNVCKFYFNANGHEPGEQIVLGKHYAEDGKAQGDAVLHDLAHNPATARHIATKLARHFIADDPPEAAIAAIAAVFTKTEGDLAEVTAAVIKLPEAWEKPLNKFRNSEDYLLAVCRALDITAPKDDWIADAYNSLGQVPLAGPSPAGWGDKTGDWAAPDNIIKRISWAGNVAKQITIQTQTPHERGQEIFGGLLNKRTDEIILHTADYEQAMKILLISPEMQRR